MRYRTVLAALVVLAVTGSLASGNPVVIIDDGPAGAPNTTDITWAPSSGAPDWNYRPESGGNAKPNSYNATGSRFAFAASPTETATYSPDLPQAGLYRVDLWWPTFAWAQNVPVTITHAEGTANVVVNQSVNSGQWNSVGIYTFNAGRDGSVMISSEGTSPGTAGVGPVADAMRFLFLGDLDPWDLPLSAVATASSTHPSGESRRLPSNVVNGSGMTDQDSDGIPETHAVSDWGNDLSWMADSIDNDPDPWLMLDLGQSYPLATMKVWNFNAVDPQGQPLTNRGVGTADLYGSVLDAPGSDFTDAAWTLLKQGVSFTEAPGTGGYDTPRVLDLGGVSARWVAIDILGNLGHPSFVGLSEVQIFRTGEPDVIPEPATVSLVALGGLGLLARRRRRR